MYKNLQPLLEVLEKNEKNYDLEKIKKAYFSIYMDFELFLTLNYF